MIFIFVGGGGIGRCKGGGHLTSAHGGLEGVDELRAVKMLTLPSGSSQKSPVVQCPDIHGLKEKAEVREG